MVEYNIVKYCSSCKSRYVVNRREAKTFLCKKCTAKK